MPASVAGKRPFSHGPQGDGPHPFNVKESSDRLHTSETITIGQPPSCVEWFRNDSRYFVIGTYKLLQGEAEGKAAERPSEPTKAQRRIGSIILCRLDSTLSTIEQQVVIRLKHAVFDLHFHHKYRDLLGVATSSTKISFFRFRPAPLSLQYLFSVPVHENPAALATFFAWSPLPTSGPSLAFTITFSDGSVRRFENIALKPFPGQKRQADTTVLQSHTLEAWYATYMTSLVGQPPNVSVSRRLLTGGDDAALIAHEIQPKPEGLQSPQPQSPIFTDTRIHTAGVTAILPLPSLRSHLGQSTGDLVLTGSYDETIRLIHISSSPPFQRKVLASSNLGGGVWRIKLLSDVMLEKSEQKSKLAFLILASCMHAGPNVLRFTCSFVPPPPAPATVTSDSSAKKGKSGKNKNKKDTKAVESKKGVTEVEQEWTIEALITNFSAHESMNYASDWALDESFEGNKLLTKEEDVVVVSTSFYDCKVCIWRPFSKPRE